MGEIDKLLQELKRQTKLLSEASEKGEARHDPWPQMYAIMWIEALAVAVQAELAPKPSKEEQDTRSTTKAKKRVLKNAKGEGKR